jgi:hypothetical protein
MPEYINLTLPGMFTYTHVRANLFLTDLTLLFGIFTEPNPAELVHND